MFWSDEFLPNKLTWQAGKSPFFHRRYNFKSKSFLLYCHVNFLGCNLIQKPTIRGTTGNAFEPRLSSIPTDAIGEGRDGLGRYKAYGQGKGWDPDRPILFP